MRTTNDKGPISLALAFVAAVVLATVWGAIVQTQFNLAGLTSIGAEIPAGLRFQWTIADIFGGFSPTYAGYVVVPSLLVAFLAASWVAGRWPGSRSFWFALAGGLALLVGIPIVNYLSPVALLVGATRNVLCTLLMALGGVGAGLLFARIPAGARNVRHQRPRVSQTAPSINPPTM